MGEQGWPQGQAVGFYPLGEGLEPSDAFWGLAEQAPLSIPSGAHRCALCDVGVHSHQRDELVAVAQKDTALCWWDPWFGLT